MSATFGHPAKQRRKRATPAKAAAATPQVAGYVADVPYTFGFKPMLAPAWLDFAAVLGGLRPPARDNGGFAWCDLGCGQGVTAAILAATHPAGAFYGIDAMAEHIAHATAFAAEAGAGNAHFQEVQFAAAANLPMPRFDYIVMHGVYSWVDRATRAQLRRFIDARLRTGGLVYVSYNAMPGWTRDLPFQHLARALADNAGGSARKDSAARFAVAARIIERLAAAGAPSLAASPIVRELRERPDDHSPGYLVHEFLHAGWEALYVTDVRRDLAEIGLRPVGSTLLVENFDRWVLGRRERRVVDAITEPDQRELVRDFLIDQRFRCDVFARDAMPIDADEQQQRLFGAGLALMRPASAIEYQMPTPAGRLDFDNEAARAVVGALAGGDARCLGDVAAGDMAPRDLLANALALCAAGDIRPVETTRAPTAAVATVNRTLRRRLGTAQEIPVIALPCGTALELDRRMLGLLAGEMNRAWRDFLARHGV